MTSTTHHNEREFNILFWGCTGYTGKLACVLFARRFGVPPQDDVKIALAGRSRGRVQQVAQAMLEAALQSPDAEVKQRAQKLQQRIDADPKTEIVPIVVVDDWSENPDKAAKMMASVTDVLLTFAGPYVEVGTPIVKACAENGTDYVDITGECGWVKDMQSRFNSKAKSTRCRIMPCCGFDYILNDVGVSSIQAHAEAVGAPPCQHITQVCNVVGSEASGGTLRSILNMLEKKSVAELLFGSADEAYEMCARVPDNKAIVAKNRDLTLCTYSADAAAWITPSLMSPSMARYIHWTNESAEYKYGKDFVFTVGAETTSIATAVFRSASGILRKGLSVIASHLTFCIRRLLPSPGVGRTLEQQQAAGNCVTVRTVGVVKPNKGTPKRIQQQINFDLGEAYVMTAYSSVCAALACLARRRLSSPSDDKFGVGSPYQLLDNDLVKQLQSAGFRMKTIEETVNC